MKLSIVIAVWNNWNYTLSCLKDLVALPDDHEIILIDNGSTDATNRLLKPDFDRSSFHKNLEIYRYKENRGFAAGYNLGFAKSLGDFVTFLNNDIRVRSDHASWTQPLIEAAKTGCLVGPTAGMLDANFNFVCETDKLPTKGYPYMSGWNLTASRKTYLDLILPGYHGPFTEEFGIAYFEDTDMSFRAREMGIPLTIVSTPVHHFGKATSKKLDTLKLYLPAKEKFIEKWKDRGKKLCLTLP